MDINISTQVAGINFPKPFMNASGVYCTTFDDLYALSQSNTGAMITKSCTLSSRNGNPEPRYYGWTDVNTCLSINSMGIPNLGYQSYLDMGPELNKIAPQIPFMLSVSGLSWDENEQILKSVHSQANSSFVKLIELNISCPNIIGKPQLGYDFDGFREVMRKLSELWDNSTPIGLKLPPYFEPSHWNEVTDIISEAQPTIRFLTCCNSFGNGLVVDFETETTRIRPKNGFGGVGGTYMKPTSLANVRKFSELLNSSNVDIIGCGGISTGRDVFEYILCGAKMTQIGTQLKETDLGLFSRIEEELRVIMQNKGYSSLEQFRGNLKTI